MRIQGTLSKWNDDRGFGFITPAQGGPEVFLHISSFPKDGRRPFIGELLEFEIEIDQKRKKRAKNVVCLSRSAARATHGQNYNSRAKTGSNSLWRIILVVIVGAILFFYGYSDRVATNTGSAESSIEQSRNEVNGDALLAHAFENHQNGLLVSGQGTVIKILPDDNDGSRHQKLIIRLNSGQTLLIAHNIDLASRVGGLNEGDTIQFHGQYEWNPKGGVIHWTHRDPNGSHPSGWLQHHGKTYQ
jgi:cold shock CspA family protein